MFCNVDGKNRSMKEMAWRARQGSAGQAGKQTSKQAGMQACRTEAARCARARQDQSKHADKRRCRRTGYRQVGKCMSAHMSAVDGGTAVATLAMGCSSEFCFASASSFELFALGAGAGGS